MTMESEVARSAGEASAQAGTRGADTNGAALASERVFGTLRFELPMNRRLILPPRPAHVPPPLRTGTTPMSRVGTTSIAARSRTRASACASLTGILLAMLATGCLITDPPSFSAPKHTKPFLDAASASPDPRAVVVVDDVLLATSTPWQTFSANVISQDDPADSNGLFQNVLTNLYIDYGFDQIPGLPWRYSFGGTTLGPGTLDQSTARPVSAKWYPTQFMVEPGCHTATLIVSHMFEEESKCPKCDNDYSTITWTVLRCDRSKGDCDSLPLDSCAVQPKTSCRTVNQMSDASECPEAADAGAP